MSPGRPDVELVRRQLMALDAAAQNLRRHAGRPLEALTQSRDEAWTVERGLPLCAQNALDVATHICAGPEPSKSLQVPASSARTLLRKG